MIGFRHRIYQIVEKSEGHSGLSYGYDIFMSVCICLSLLPLFFRQQHPVFYYFDLFTVIVFILDYIAHWMTADLRRTYAHRWAAFLLYPITPMGIVDLLSILPGVNLLPNGYKIFRVSRLLKIVRVFKFFRYSEQFQLLFRVLRNERKVLLSVLMIAVFYIAVFYIVVTALIMFNAGQGSSHFDSYFDALYWATTTLTTVGYGDIYPANDLGRVISMLSALFGVAIIALPSGIITASYLDELRKERDGK